jgi:hypothetical protein
MDGFITGYSIHHLADIRQASSPFWVLSGTMAAPGLFSRNDLFHDARASIFRDILDDIVFGVTETITDDIAHVLFFSFGGLILSAQAVVVRLIFPDYCFLHLRRFPVLEIFIEP